MINLGSSALHRSIAIAFQSDCEIKLKAMLIRQSSVLFHSINAVTLFLIEDQIMCQNFNELSICHKF